MEQLSTYVAKKRSIAEQYSKALAGVPGIELMKSASWAESTYWMYTVLVDPETFGMDSRQLLKTLESKRIQTRPAVAANPSFSDLCRQQP